MTAPTDTHETTSLYRLYDATGALLYVGIARSWPARMAQHRAEKVWWDHVANVTVEVYPTRADAEDAERKAIRSEKPQHNVVHNGRHGNGRSAALGGLKVLADSIGLAPRSFDHSHFAALEEYALLQKAISDFLNAAQRADEGAQIEDVVDLVRTAYAGDYCRCENGDVEISWPFAAEVTDGWMRGRYRCRSCGQIWVCGYTARPDVIATLP